MDNPVYQFLFCFTFEKAGITLPRYDVNYTIPDITRDLYLIQIEKKLVVNYSPEVEKRCDLKYDKC